MNAAGRQAGQETTAKPQLLIVSGDAMLRERLYDLLTAQGCSVKTAASGRLGLEMIMRYPPNLIIANSSADDVSGWGFPDRIRRFDLDVPIILLWHASGEPPDGRTASDIQAYFPSDVPNAVLLAAVRRWLKIAESSRMIEPINYPGTILAVDDEPGFLQALEAFLRPRLCDIVTAQSGEEGLNQLKRCHPTLVLLDLKMPGMDGLVALRKFKELQPDLPVIMMTGEDDAHLMQQALALGAFEYVVKPYDFKMLRTTIIQVKQLLEMP